jgi:hypothetical protein
MTKAKPKMPAKRLSANTAYVFFEPKEWDIHIDPRGSLLAKDACSPCMHGAFCRVVRVHDAKACKNNHR